MLTTLTSCPICNGARKINGDWCAYCQSNGNIFLPANWTSLVAGIKPEKPEPIGVPGEPEYMS